MASSQLLGLRLHGRAILGYRDARLAARLMMTNLFRRDGAARTSVPTLVPSAAIGQLVLLGEAAPLRPAPPTETLPIVGAVIVVLLRPPA